jgi:hypothetical protein
MVGKNQIGRNADLERLGSLMLQGLVNRADSAIENRFHQFALLPAGESSDSERVRRSVPGASGRESQGLFNDPKPMPLRAPAK